VASRQELASLRTESERASQEAAALQIRLEQHLDPVPFVEKLRTW